MALHAAAAWRSPCSQEGCLIIHESQIKKVYGSDVKVVRKGDRDWTSDADHEREVAWRDPRLKFVNGDRAPLRPRVERDWSEITESHEFRSIAADDQFTWYPPGVRVSVPYGPDRLTFELREDRTWRYCYRERNAAL